jgi:hypothetical protein
VTESSSSPSQPPVKLDTSVAHSARLWNYLLGGKDNFAADREAAEMALALMPELVESARADREFLGRAVRFLAGEAGIRQFLDIGTGLPTANNTHEVAQAVAPESRIVYVDNDPMVLVHARALLTSTPQGATDYIDADARDPETILAAAGRTLDFKQPVAVMLLGILRQLPGRLASHPRGQPAGGRRGHADVERERVRGDHRAYQGRHRPFLRAAGDPGAGRRLVLAVASRPGGRRHPQLGVRVRGGGPQALTVRRRPC